MGGGGGGASTPARVRRCPARCSAPHVWCGVAPPPSFSGGDARAHCHRRGTARHGVAVCRSGRHRAARRATRRCARPVRSPVRRTALSLSPPPLAPRLGHGQQQRVLSRKHRPGHMYTAAVVKHVRRPPADAAALLRRPRGRYVQVRRQGQVGGVAQQQLPGRVRHCVVRGPAPPQCTAAFSAEAKQAGTCPGPMAIQCSAPLAWRARHAHSFSLIVHGATAPVAKQ